MRTVSNLTVDTVYEVRVVALTDYGASAPSDSVFVATKCMSKLYKEPQHDKTKKMTCVPSEDSDQPGHLPSLIRVFAVHSMGS